MTIQDLLNQCDENGIRVDDFTLHKKKAFAIRLEDGTCAIALDKTKIESEAEYLEIMAEEVGHISTNALCYLSDYYNPLYYSNIKKAEHKAMAWAYTNLIPLDELKHALKKEADPYLVAEGFGVTYEFLKKCVAFYRRKYGKL